MNQILDKGVRIFWSLYFVLSIAVIGFFCGYLLVFSLLFLSFLCGPWPKASVFMRHRAEDFQCLSIRFLLKIQPWLECETNFHSILGFYRPLATRKVVFVANHRSNLDTFLLISYIPGLRGLAKSSLFYNIFFAPFMWVIGFVPVDKGSAQSFISGIDLIKKRILAQDKSVLVFPENTRCEKGFPSINKFSGAFFSMAIDSQALIVPIVIKGTDQLMGRGDLFLNPYQPVQIRMLDPVQANQYSDFFKLKEDVWSQMQKALV